MLLSKAVMDFLIIIVKGHLFVFNLYLYQFIIHIYRRT